MTRKRKSPASLSSADPKRPAPAAALLQQICTTRLLQPPAKQWPDLSRSRSIRPSPPTNSGTAERNPASRTGLQTSPPRTTLPGQAAHFISEQPTIGQQLPDCSHRALAAPPNSRVTARVARTQLRADRLDDHRALSANIPSSLPFAVRVSPAPFQEAAYDARSAVDGFLSLHNGSDEESDDSSDSNDDASVVVPRSHLRGSYSESFASQIPVDSQPASEGVDPAFVPVLIQADPSAEPLSSDSNESASRQIAMNSDSRALKSSSSPATLALRVAGDVSSPHSTSHLRRSPSSRLESSSEGSPKHSIGLNGASSMRAKSDSRDTPSNLTKTVQFRDTLSEKAPVSDSLRRPSDTASRRLRSSVLSDVSNRSDQRAGPEKALYDEMNEIVSDVLNVTRALPTSKPSSSSRVIGSDSAERFYVDHRSSTRGGPEAACTDQGNAALLSSTLIGNKSGAKDRDVDQIHDLLRYKIETTNETSSPDLVDCLDYHSDCSSELSSLSRTPSLPDNVARTLEDHSTISAGETRSLDRKLESEVLPRAKPARVKRKTTGSKSKHFSPVKKNAANTLADTPLRRSVKKEVNPSDSEAELPSTVETTAIVDDGDEQPAESDLPKQESTRPKRKTTGSKSDHFSLRPKTDPALFDRVDLYNPHGGVRKSTAGISTNPVPSTRADTFGIVQERLWREPFWLIIAVVFLNQTTGRAAMPVFWALKAQYITIEALAAADPAALRAAIEHLGLGNQRSKRIIAIAQLWLTNPPVAQRRYRTLHYPSPGDGKALKPDAVLDTDATLTPGALELGHVPGCKAYAYDSWRIFCRDVLRGVAEDYRGLNAAEGEDFEPEWKRVVPGDKELRACLRWMWLKEGYIWDPLTGGRREATKEEMELAVKGQMEMGDEKERRFAVLAARNAAADDDGVADGDGVEGEGVVHDSEQVLETSVPQQR